MNASIHLQNQITAAIDHMRGTEDFDWDHRITERVIRVIAMHEGCTYCSGGV